ncbi:hypothetical protein PC121_g21312 [Phytophthora cactorum]|nr:hypothetical protein PC120_g21616 [Phytophthora cactorum]KAG3045366.1 hypothetical protein PC121_g21312 [Phytophthora cactorum]
MECNGLCISFLNLQFKFIVFWASLLGSLSIPPEKNSLFIARILIQFANIMDGLMLSQTPLDADTVTVSNSRDLEDGGRGRCKLGKV